MENSKSTRYFKYAIGEIILVVIGILIALQINNWNEDRKDSEEESIVLAQLALEFQNNLEQLDEKISVRNKMIDASILLLNYVDNPMERNKDSILKYLTQTITAPTFDPIANDLVGTGKLRLLRNNRLKQLLSFWTSELVQVTEDEQAWRNIAINSYFPFVMQHTNYREILANYWETDEARTILIDKDQNYSSFKIPTSKRNEDILKLLEINDFEDYLADSMTWNKLTNVQSMALRKRIVEILELIQKDLNK